MLSKVSVAHLQDSVQQLKAEAACRFGLPVGCCELWGYCMGRKQLSLEDRLLQTLTAANIWDGRNFLLEHKVGSTGFWQVPTEWNWRMVSPAVPFSACAPLVASDLSALILKYSAMPMAATRASVMLAFQDALDPEASPRDPDMPKHRMDTCLQVVETSSVCGCVAGTSADAAAAAANAGAPAAKPAERAAADCALAAAAPSM